MLPFMRALLFPVDQLIVCVSLFLSMITPVACSQVLNERDMNSLHKTVPALRRHDVNTATIRQHYYPEGGWGWIVCACGFLVHVFTTGMQFSYGVLYLEAVKIHGRESAMDAGNFTSFPLYPLAKPQDDASLSNTSAKVPRIRTDPRSPLSNLLLSLPEL